MTQTRGRPSPPKPGRSVRALQQAGRSVRPARNPGLPAIRRRVLLGMVWAGLIVLLSFWWNETPPPSVLGTPALLTEAGRLAGLIGGYLLLIQILLMSRLRVIDEAVSGFRKSAWHRQLGAYVICIITLHIILITLGYAATARTGVWHEAWTLLTTNEDMISALVAFGIMVILAFTAIRAIRTRVPYGVWHVAHSGVYFVLLFVYGHQFADGQQFVLSHAARVYWAVLYFVVIAAVLYGRIVAPLLLNLRHDLRVDAVVVEAPGVTSIYLTGRRLEKFPAIAGQYVRWRFLTGQDWWRSHPFSLSAAPNGAWLRLTVKASGDYSSRLQEISVGTRVLADSPTGEFTADHRVRSSALLIAGGSGIAPIRAIAETLPSGGVLIFRARTREDLIFKDELDKLAASRRMRVHYLVGHRDDPQPSAALSAAGLRELVPDVAARDVYVCGPRGLTEAVGATLIELRLPHRQIHLDPFEL